MFEVIVLLVAAHALFDYALQGDFMAKAKNPAAPIPGVPWYQPMSAHCFIHATAVYLITGTIVAGIFEFVAHFVIDYMKCTGNLSYNQDQFLHLACKAGYVLALVLVAA